MFSEINSGSETKFNINGIIVKTHRVPMLKFKAILSAKTYEDFINSLMIEDRDDRYDRDYWNLVDQWENHNAGDININCGDGTVRWVYFEPSQR